MGILRVAHDIAVDKILKKCCNCGWVEGAPLYQNSATSCSANKPGWNDDKGSIAGGNTNYSDNPLNPLPDCGSTSSRDIPCWDKKKQYMHPSEGGFPGCENTGDS